MKTFLKFALVGIINTLVDLGVLNLIIASSDIGQDGTAYAAAKACSFIAAVIVSYALNRRYVFGAGGRTRAFEQSSFIAVSLAGLALNTAGASVMFKLIAGMHAPFGVDISTAVAATASALVGTGAVLLFNFFGYKYIVFRRQPTRQAA